jgi:nitrate/nitrite transporter NarK
MTPSEREERTSRRTAACFCLGACLMLVAAARDGNRLMLLSAALLGVAWASFAFSANRIAAARRRAPAGGAHGSSRA